VKHVTDLLKIAQSGLEHQPFDWFATSEFLEAEFASALAETFPSGNFLHSKTMEASFYFRNFITNSTLEPSAHTLSPTWTQLGEYFVSSEYAHAISQLTGLNLEGARVDAALCEYYADSYAKPHTDREMRLVTQLVYFNELWLPNWGGRFLILGSDSLADVVRAFLPVLNTSVVFVRAPNSWHAVESIKSGIDVTRRSLLLHFSRP
jgi:Rps23 Pro-64 3,4-dihydroxylase Tpa1-like proline 4-hydroxylase